MNKKKVLMVIPHMVGGGAERVAAQIMNKLNERGYDTRFILTSAKKNEVVRSDLNERTELILLTEEMKAETTGKKLTYLPARAYSTIFGKFYEKQNKYVPATIGKATIEWQYHREIAWLRKYMQENPDMTVIVFLQPSIPIVLLAAQDLPNKVIISERMDPRRLMKKRYGKKFVEKYYKRADNIVFQTETAKKMYPESLMRKSVVIPNPLKDNLPQSFHGERNKYISTFCRIHQDKDLITLLKAFNLLLQMHSDYKLRIIGDAKNEKERQYKQEISEFVKDNGLEDFVLLMPFNSNVHQEIIHDTMYVNSSISEGLSNAMLEAMAIGMPVVCTDCPIGGARDTIEHEVNGLLVPINDFDTLANAMIRLIENKALAEKLSNNASKLRDEITLDKITDKWEKLLCD